MSVLVSTKINELKLAVLKGDNLKVKQLIDDIKKIKDDPLVNRITKLIVKNNSNEIISNQIENKIDSKELKNDYNFFVQKNTLNKYIKERELKKGVSFVTVSMNREENLLKALPTWLETEVDEIIIVDWSSKERLEQALKNINDPRIVLVQINQEQKWVLTHAFNVGLKLASREKIYKLDSDILVKKNFISENKILENEFIRGFWKFAIDAGDDNQKYVNGTFGAFNKNLKNIGYYDERITTYGWDDSDIYYRLVNFEGLIGKFLNYGTIFHQEQEQNQRIESQVFNTKRKFLGKFEITEIENSRNKFKSYFRDMWGASNYQQDYELHLVNNNMLVGNRITIYEEPQAEVVRYSELFATREFLGWSHSDFHCVNLKILKSLPFSKLINELIRDENEMKFKEALDKKNNIKIIYVETPSLLELTIFSLNKIIEIREINNLPIILVVSSESNIEIESVPNLYIINSSIALAIENALVDVIKSSCFYDCVDVLNDSAEVVKLTRDSIVMSCWSYKDRIQTTIGKFGTNRKEQFFKLIISLYDEKNLYRIRDYLTCLLINVSICDAIEIYYESTNGSLISFLSRMIIEHNSKKIYIKFWNRRPTYTELFNQNSKDNRYITVVANADVFFDESLYYIDYSNIQESILAVSRRDVYYDDDQYKSRLIKYENGAPNILSADAWIAPSNISLPNLDYQLGTIHCDSFFFNAILNRSANVIINPALDLNVFHLHDERFNSSEEKQKRDKVEIETKLEAERVANNGVNPVSGVSWSSIREFNRFKISKLQRWRPNSIIVNITKDTHIILNLLLSHYMSMYLDKEDDIMIVLNISNVNNKVAIERFLGFINAENIQIDLEFDNSKQILNSNFNELLELIQDKNPGAMLNYLRHNFSGSNSGMKSLSFDLTSSELCQTTLIQHIIGENKFKSKELMDSYFEVIASNSYELSYYLPYVSDYKCQMIGEGFKSKSIKPRVSFITSMFNAGMYLPSFLENIHCAAVCAQGEVILIDVNSHDEDEKIVRKFIKENGISDDLIRYERLNYDPGLYKTWEYAIDKSRSELISNANVDDKRSASHSKILTAYLTEKNNYAGACGSIWASTEGPDEKYTSRVNGEIWFYENQINEVNFDNLWLNESGNIKSRNIMHCIPIWRKKLHEKYGFFDEESYGTSADWAFWLKCTKSGEVFLHVRDVFGKYYINPKSHNRVHDINGIKEARIIKDFLSINQEKIIKQ